MSDERIYFKTAAGETAVRERTRLVQRNLRTVLILVDGLADVGALKTKAGDAAMVDAAVIELEAMGLIEARDEGQREASGVTPPLTFESDDSSQTDIPWSTPDVASEIQVHADATRPRLPEASGPLSGSHWWSELRQRRREAREEAIYEKAYGGTSDPSTVPSPMAETPLVVETAASKPRGKRRLRIGTLVLIAGMVGLVLAALRVVFYPYEAYKPRFEQALTQALGDTVSIGSLRVGFLPMPVIMLEKVSVGDTPPYAAAEMVKLSPELSSLFGDHHYRRVTIQGMKFSSAGISRISRWFAPSGMGKAVIDRLDLESLWFNAGGHSLGPLEGSATIDPVRGVGQIHLGGSERLVQVEAVPTPAGLSVALSASNWLSPLLPPIKFASLEVKGELDGTRFSIQKLEGMAYDGQFSGVGEIGWRDGVTLALSVDARHITVAKLLDAFRAPSLIDGSADAKLRFASRADRLARLNEDLRVDGSFTLVHGQLKRLDFAEALRLVAQRPPGVARGGTTGFENLEGRLTSDGHLIRLTGLRMASGLMQASGSAVLSRGAEPSISGSINVAINGGAGVHNSLAIAGSADDPELRAGR